MYNQCDVSNECTDGDSTLDSWSFPTSLNRFSVKKLKSRLGRRKLSEQPNNSSSEDLKQNVNSGSCISKENSESAVSVGSHNDDFHPIHLLENDELSEAGSPDSGTVTENEISKTTLNSTSNNNLSHCDAMMKTPCKSFYLQDFTFGSPLDPLSGILNSKSPAKGKKDLSERLDSKLSSDDTTYFSPKSRVQDGRNEEEQTEFFSPSSGNSNLNESFLSQTQDNSTENGSFKTDHKPLKNASTKSDDSGNISGLQVSPGISTLSKIENICNAAISISTEFGDPVGGAVIKDNLDTNNFNLNACIPHSKDPTDDLPGLVRKSLLDQVLSTVEVEKVVSSLPETPVTSIGIGPIKSNSCKSQTNQNYPFANLFLSNFKAENPVNSSKEVIPLNIKRQTEVPHAAANILISKTSNQNLEKGVDLNNASSGDIDLNVLSKPVALECVEKTDTVPKQVFQNNNATFENSVEVALDSRFQKPLTATHGKTLHPAAFLKENHKNPSCSNYPFASVMHKFEAANSGSFSSEKIVSSEVRPVGKPIIPQLSTSAVPSLNVATHQATSTSGFSTPAAWSTVSKPTVPSGVTSSPCPSEEMNRPTSFPSSFNVPTPSAGVIKNPHQSAFLSHHASTRSLEPVTKTDTMPAVVSYPKPPDSKTLAPIKPNDIHLVSDNSSKLSHPAAPNHQVTKSTSANQSSTIPPPLFRQSATLPTAFPALSVNPVVRSSDSAHHQPVNENVQKPLSNSLKENHVSRFPNYLHKIPSMPSLGVAATNHEVLDSDKDLPIELSAPAVPPAKVESTHPRNKEFHQPNSNFIHQPSVFGASQKFPVPEMVRSKSLAHKPRNESLSAAFGTQSQGGIFSPSFPPSLPLMNRAHSSDSVLNRQNSIQSHQLNSNVDPKIRQNTLSHNNYPFKLQEGVGSSSLFGPYPSENKENFANNVNRLSSHSDALPTFKRPFQPPPPQLKYGQVPAKVSSPSVYVNGHAYTLISIIGKGGSSVVYQVIDEGTETAKLKAVKKVDLSSVESSIADGYLNEINLLHKLQECDSVIKMFDFEYLKREKILYVVMEKGDTDFARLIKDITVTKKISTSMIIYYWTEMLNAVKDIHERGIIHSDLKPANFLLVSGRLKLIDFGIASSLQGDMTSVIKDSMAGTFNYMSPEALTCNNDSQRGAKISYRSDIWSLGCILYNLVYGKTPYSHLGNVWARVSAIKDPSSIPKFPKPDSDIPTALSIALRWCLKKVPRDRPTARQLLELPYYGPSISTDRGQRVRIETLRHTLEMFPECNVEVE